MGEMFSFPNAESNRPKNEQSSLEGSSSGGQSGDQVPQASGANADESFEFELVDPDQLERPECAPAQAVHVSKQERHFERRKRRRAIISAPVRVRGVDVTDGGPDEVLTTTNVSRTGILFHTFNRTYSRGMNLAVTFPYSNISGAIQAERWGRIARISELSDGRQAIAVEFCESDESLVDASGRQLGAEAVAPSSADLSALYPEVDAKKPVVLAVDADKATREMLKNYLTGEGYNVIAVSGNVEAREVLKIMTPALVIAEIEGENLPGYDLCAHIKSTQHLKRIPVMLMTSSAFPSDYASAHSLGAVVCIAKPFRQERFGHVVRMLAPPPQGKEKCSPARPADPTRRHISASSMKYAQAKNLPGKRFQLRRGK